MRTSAGLRRFPSSHPSLIFSIFSGILENRMRGDRGGGLNRVAMPCRPLGGRPAPLHHVPRQGPVRRKNSKKNYRKVPVARCLGDRGHRGLSPTPWATGAHFRNFLKRPHIFEILIFFNIKKKKTQDAVLCTRVTCDHGGGVIYSYSTKE